MVGLLPNSIGGNRYFITFTDDYTAHLNVDFMKHKSSALARFHVWKVRIEKETGQKLGKIQVPTQPRFRGAQSQWWEYKLDIENFGGSEISDRVMRDVTGDRKLG
jgi:hypothetical protein